MSRPTDYPDLVSDSVGSVVDLRPLAFVISGGAASGATQVGQLLALRDAGVTPDLIVGTSVGAINGCVAAADFDGGPTLLRDVWAEVDREEILGSWSIKCLPRLARTRRHLFGPGALRSLIKRNLSVETFAELQVRFAAMATRVDTGSPDALVRGRLDEALIASAAIPGIFPRVEIDGVHYLDGGVTANVPIRQAFELGAAGVIVLNAAPANGPSALPTNIAETLQYVTSILMRHQVSATVELAERGRVAELPRTTPAGLGVFDFSRTGELIDAAYTATSEQLTRAPLPL